MKCIIITTVALALAGCTADTLDTYRPVTDPGSRTQASYESDLSQCRAVAQRAEAEYKQRQRDQMMGNLVAGLILGAATGAIVGDSSSWAGYGAATGAASGIAATDTELAVGGPRRIIDRCLASRGHVVLSDLGRG